MITVTFNFDSVEAAAEFLNTQGVQPPQVVNVVALPDAKKPRQPRSDAGKPRGPYKTTGADAGATASSTPGTTPGAGAAGGDPVSAEGTPAQPTTAAPAPTTSAPKELTLDDVKAAMAVLNKAKGIDANIQQLAKFGVQKASSLPKAKYAEFIAAVLKAAS